MKPRYIVLVGSQGSGKGTQAEFLSARLGIPSLSPGQLFRAEIEKGTGLGEAVRDYVAHGEIVPSDIADQVIAGRLDDPDTKKGVIFDGFPRIVEQAQQLDAMLARQGNELSDVIEIAVTDEEAMRRLTGRLVCSNKHCGANYHLTSKKPKKKGVCDRCGSPLERRADDVPDIIARRLRIYHTDTAALIGHYKAHERVHAGHILYHHIDGMQQVAKVAADIAAALKLPAQ